MDFKRKHWSRYSAEWEKSPQFRGWLTESTKGPLFAHCKACKTDLCIASGRKELTKHSTSMKHRNRLNYNEPTTVRREPTTAPLTLQDRVDDATILIAAFIIEHDLPANAANHLSDLICRVCPDSAVSARLKSDRRDAMKTITDVLGRYSEEQLVSALRDNKFSLLIGESTNRNVLYLAARVKYDNAIKDCFLSTIELNETTVNVLFEEIIAYFQQKNIPYERNMIGLSVEGVDEVTTMRLNGVAEKFSRIVPGLFVLAHPRLSLHLCTSSACEKLPLSVELLVRNVHNHFRDNPKRAIRRFASFAEFDPHKTMHPSQTRWISSSSIVHKMLKHYDALVLHFKRVTFDNPDDSLAGIVLDALTNPKSKLYLHFLSHALPLFDKLNRSIANVYSDIKILAKSILECFIDGDVLNATPLNEIDYDNPVHFKNLNDMYFGVEISESNLLRETLNTVKMNCLFFYKESLKQIFRRFPVGDDALEGLNFLDPVMVKSKKVGNIRNAARRFPTLWDDSEENAQSLENEWKMLLANNRPVADNITDFWNEIVAKQFNDGYTIFPALSTFILNILLLPHFSVDVKKTFSLERAQFNEILIESYASVFHAKRLVELNGHCYNFQVNNIHRKLLNDN